MITNKPSLLLHVCCAPCSPYVVKMLKKNYTVTAYFYDPNIHPEEEYTFRLKEMKKFSQEIGLSLIEAEYDAGRWFETTKGREEDAEKGERCYLCVDFRLEKAARFALENGFEYFTTVLSVSPHKSAKMINSIGRILSKKHFVKFLEADFKKKDGFKKSVEMSKAFGLKRQDYCGCVYSKKGQPSQERGKRETTKRQVAD